MANLSKQTPTQRKNFWYMAEAMRRFEWDLHNKIERTGHIPAEWHAIAKSPVTRPKRQVNLGLEEDVLRFFRSMGKGYGDRINAILKSYMHARLAGLVEGAETMNHYKEWQEGQDIPKPQFGDTAKAAGEDWEDLPPPKGFYAKHEQVMEVVRREHTRRDGEKEA